MSRIQPQPWIMALDHRIWTKTRLRLELDWLEFDLTYLLQIKPMVGPRSINGPKAQMVIHSVKSHSRSRSLPKAPHLKLLFCLQALFTAASSNSSSAAKTQNCEHPEKYVRFGANQYGKWPRCNLCQQKLSFERYSYTNPPPSLEERKTHSKSAKDDKVTLSSDHDLPAGCAGQKSDSINTVIHIHPPCAFPGHFESEDLQSMPIASAKPFELELHHVLHNMTRAVSQAVRMITGKQFASSDESESEREVASVAAASA